MTKAKLVYDEFSPRSHYRLKKAMSCANRHSFRRGAIVYRYEPDGCLHCPYCGARLK